jgi:arylsulfatase A-like enzyme
VWPRRREAPAEAPTGPRNLVVVVLDSLRHDVAAEAATPNLDRLGQLEKRWSYASWTAPSHYNLLTGLLPHDSPVGVYASDYYQRDYLKYAERLRVPDMEFKKLLPGLWLPTYLRDVLGYGTHARVSMPVLNPTTGVNRGFDSFRLMPKHNDMAAMLDDLSFSTLPQPFFALLNVGETHYPYALPDEDPAGWPLISGVHGVLKRVDDASGELTGGSFFDDSQMAMLRSRQQTALEYVDGVIGRLVDELPADTWLVVTSDHGELFGEDGYFGHGPIAHEKVHEVPFWEGPLS